MPQRRGPAFPGIADPRVQAPDSSADANNAEENGSWRWLSVNEVPGVVLSAHHVLINPQINPEEASTALAFHR